MNIRQITCALLCIFTTIVFAQNGNIDVAPKDRFSAEGASWNINGETGNVRIQLRKLTFNHGGNTGTIKLVLFASRTPFKPGASGWPIAESRLGQLNERQFYSNLSKNANLVRPPVGTYYVTLMVQEFYNGQWKIQRSMNGTKTTTFR
ncbi:MAG: hypothetical protein JNJ83_04815 [Verrucomicrobiaceae bacterium]|nr:hypothetical protein [Verrucomicrobiaceae bacterium]